jgi:hypothetical protein
MSVHNILAARNNAQGNMCCLHLQVLWADHPEILPAIESLGAAYLAIFGKIRPDSLVTQRWIAGNFTVNRDVNIWRCLVSLLKSMVFT